MLSGENVRCSVHLEGLSVANPVEARGSQWNGETLLGSPPRPPTVFPWANVLLFVATLFTTIIAGAGWAGVDLRQDPHLFYRGFPFAGALLLILGCHEAGHYVLSRRWGVPASLPYFIPLPMGLGTLGAFIKLRSPILNRRVLFDIGAAGPLAGFVVAIPIILIGLSLSDVQPSTHQPGLTLGSSLLFSFLTKWVLGASPSDYTIILHPLAFAGWIGLFITALNLLPVGQLDGGHLIYAIFSKRHRIVTVATLAILIPLGFFWQGWFVWAALTVFFGFHHPPVIDELTPLDRGRKYLGWVCLAIFALSFTPVPFQI